MTPGEMTAVSLFDGIGGFPEALRRAGVRTIATVEIDPAAAGVATDRFPDAKQLSDVTEVTPDDLLAAGFVPGRGILTAGWPCQDLSLAGRRLGLGGARSGLFWEVVRLAAGLRPRWLLLENVPGLLSAVCSCPGLGVCGTGCTGPHPVRGGACGPGRCMELHGGAMGAVLGTLGELGYGLAYRVLDARHFGVPQRRRRVVIVGRLGDGAAPAAVLLEPEGGGRHPAAGSETRAGAAGVAAVGTLQGGGRGHRLDTDDMDGMAALYALIRDTGHVNALTANMAGGGGGPDDNTAQGGHLIPTSANTLTVNGARSNDPETEQLVGFDLAQITSGENRSRPTPGKPQAPQAAAGRPHVAYSLRRDPGGTGQGHDTNYVTHALTAEGADASEDGTERGTPLVPAAFGHTNGLDPQAGERVIPALRAGHDVGAGSVMEPTAVRRLTPVECERLQGYPDGWTATSNGRPQSDSARYRQLGNSIAIPVFSWVARRIVAYEAGERA